MEIIRLDQIKKILKNIDIISEIEQGFLAYSSGKVITPPVGELLFKQPPGDVHIKYGYIIGDPYYVIKIASGFYDNPKLHLPSSNGLLLIFSQKTGEILGILLDEGYLTDLRTAAAGAITAKYLAPATVNNIGIVGTGTQARLQLFYLKQVTTCRKVIVWGRDDRKLTHFRNSLEKEGFSIKITQHIEELTSACNLIVTTTPAISPLLSASRIRQGTHITAVGADSPHKQELDPAILKIANIIVADSIEQCVERGEIAHAVRNKFINKEKLIELGNIISGTQAGRTSDEQITVADLTGLAVQDIQIAKAVYNQSF
ncbi:MAG: ornithine cyclodeaminase family protein [Gammaproteobacteria bacterium]